MEFYDKYGKIKRISVKFEPVEKKEPPKKPEGKKESKPEPVLKPVAKPAVEVAAEEKAKPELKTVEELEIEAADKKDASLIAELFAEPSAEPSEEPAGETKVELTSKHWTVPVSVTDEEPETLEDAEPVVAAAPEPEPEPLPEVEVTSKHWTVPVPVVEPQLEIVKEEEGLMATNRFDKTPKKEINYCEDICKDEEQKKVCFYYRNKEYLTDNFINKCDDAKAYELSQKKEQEERAERERLLKELFGNQEE